MKILASFLVVSLVLAEIGIGRSLGADEPSKPLAKAIRFEFQQPGSLESALGVRRASGSIETTRAIGKGRLVVDLYHMGKIVATESIGLGVSPRASETRWEFVVQVIDLDILRLGDGKPGHSRFILTLKAADSFASTKRDVAKDVFPIGGDSGGSAFNVKASSTATAPLGFLILKTRPDKSGNLSISGAGTIEQALEGNPNGDLAVVRFVLDNGREVDQRP